jgi:hypothetical protein
VKPSFLFDVGHTVGDDLRLGLVVGATAASTDDSTSASQATLGRVDLELAWLPHGDGLFLRGAAGLAWLEQVSDVDLETRDFNSTGLDLSVGVGWFGAPWREAYPLWTTHLVVGVDLGWQHYFGGSSVSGPVKSSLSWSLRAGIQVW